jgi:hypothetical protein
MTFQEDDNPYAPPKTMGTISALGSEQTLQRVATGLNLVYWGIGIVLISVICTFVISIALQGSLEAVFILIGFCTFGIVLGIVVGFIGRVLCLAVPAETRAQGLIYGAVAFDLIAVAVHIADVFLESEVLEPAGNLCSLVAIILFVLFLKRVSEFVGRSDLAERAKALLGLGVAVFVVTILGGVMSIAAPMIMVLIALILIVVALTMLVLYLRLLRDLRLAIQRRP